MIKNVSHEYSLDRLIRALAHRGDMCRDFPLPCDTCPTHSLTRHLCTRKDSVLARRSLRKENTVLVKIVK